VFAIHLCLPLQRHWLPLLCLLFLSCTDPYHSTRVNVFSSMTTTHLLTPLDKLNILTFMKLIYIYPWRATTLVQTVCFHFVRPLFSTCISDTVYYILYILPRGYAVNTAHEDLGKICSRPLLLGGRWLGHWRAVAGLWVSHWLPHRIFALGPCAFPLMGLPCPFPQPDYSYCTSNVSTADVTHEMASHDKVV
jgi:hypothetical protein